MNMPAPGSTDDTDRRNDDRSLSPGQKLTVSVSLGGIALVLLIASVVLAVMTTTKSATLEELSNQIDHLTEQIDSESARGVGNSLPKTGVSGRLNVGSLALMTLSEIPQACSTKFPR